MANKRKVSKLPNANIVLGNSIVIGLFVTVFFNLGFGLAVSLLGVCYYVMKLYFFDLKEATQ